VLGAMNFGQIGHTTQDEAIAIVDAILETGINVIDTADRYSGGESEEGHLYAQPAVADTVSPADVLDAIVDPGTDLAAHEKFDTPPALLYPALRRR